MRTLSLKHNLPQDAIITNRTQESSDIFTLHLTFTDPEIQKQYQFKPGQFNMLYLMGVGEVAISIVSDPEGEGAYQHTIRRVGRVTHGFSLLKENDHVGIRGPFGHGWPIDQAINKDVLIITGGLGCAPSISIINYIVKRREHFGRLFILQGVKHSDDLIYKEYYQRWSNLPNTKVLLAADQSTKQWRWYTGFVTDLIDQIDLDPNNTITYLCGPEGMMQSGIDKLMQLQFSEHNIYLNFERNMECAIGHCGHCQFGGQFVCKDGPVFCYADIKDLLGKTGF